MQRAGVARVDGLSRSSGTSDIKRKRGGVPVIPYRTLPSARGTMSVWRNIPESRTRNDHPLTEESMSSLMKAADTFFANPKEEDDDEVQDGIWWDRDGTPLCIVGTAVALLRAR